MSVIGYDDTADEFTALYADGRAVARVCRGSMTDRTWPQQRTARSGRPTSTRRSCVRGSR
ncbi:hypothetical protein ACM01_18730 [Streptomyces viridochromogenes]|uniref:Uncharacterized protein n=1 Tax=Streptomyces viridochromogenes TaxID=1938 RepID=A0A0J8C6N8_STRVR|nr:hypothetical protein ACM01_18730 [Streptomyces viridochromogenes]KOG20717.1 hypothetical protein ADK36_15990 [Streptomyces viridochromogenes]KOG21508.1 hypothetical protein ADK35_16325 [Streptomyces viridochromogenes]